MEIFQMVTQLQAPFNNMITLSIKEYKHSQRLESAHLEFTISGPKQVRPSDFTKELKN